jgi:hypothetical protein
MARGFDTALLNRERDRLLLAEALDSKYEQEANRRMFVRVFVLAVAGFFAFLGFRGMQTVGNLVDNPGLAKKKPSAPDPGILAQMKKQAAEGDALLGGAETKEEAVPEKRRSRGAVDDFSSRIPRNLYSDVTRPHSVGGGRLLYDPAGPRARQELEELSARSARHPPVDYGKYRPGVNSDLPKLPQPRAGHAAPPASLYAQLPIPPQALESDAREFPQPK